MKIIASKKDILKEIWIRNYNKKEIVWKTKEGKTISIQDLTDEHLTRIFNMIIKKEESNLNYIDALESFNNEDE